MSNKREAWVDLQAAVYGMDGSIGHWMQKVAEHALTVIGDGSGVVARLIRTRPGLCDGSGPAVFGRDEITRAIESRLATIPRERLVQLSHAPQPVGTVEELVGPGLATHDPHFDTLLVIACPVSVAFILLIAARSSSHGCVTRHQRQQLSEFAAHVSASLNLRIRLMLAAQIEFGETTPDEASTLDDSLPSAKAWLGMAIARLRDMTLTSMHTRTDAGILWRDLLIGRWTLIAHFSDRGAWTMVALRSPPGAPDPRALTKTQRAIATDIGRGASAKEISLDRGVSLSAVNNALTAVRRKLGLHSRVEVAAFFAPAGTRSRLSRLDLCGFPLLIGRYGGVADGERVDLTEAERTIISHLRRGYSNREIARARGTSYHTVANQVGTILAKFRVHNRVELVAGRCGKP